jgi:tRNA1(Val) A37 N6-methylase TrmN6
MPLPKATELAHQLAAKRLRRKSKTIDATAGNGHDTLFLAQKVGPDGKVYAFDLQEAAIASTRERMEKEDCAKQVSLHHASHTDMHAHIPESAQGKIKVVMFNLGYLPGSDKSITTQWPQTLQAVKVALSLISEDGLVTIVAYPGHPAGAEEANALSNFAQWLDPEEFSVAHYAFQNRPNKPPFLIAIERA